MSAPKTVNTRISNKHDYEANWNKATTFVPLAGELIVYDADVDAPEAVRGNNTKSRIKVGDGITAVQSLPFITGDIQIPITHKELVQLRDGRGLIPGAYYRITDYLCTSSQTGTAATNGCKFDIIVQALSESTLSEDAKADFTLEQGLDRYRIKQQYVTDDYTLRSELITIFGYELVDTNDSSSYTRSISDRYLGEYDYLPNNLDMHVPVLYFVESSGEYAGEADYGEEFFYDGYVLLDNMLCDRWRKIEHNLGDGGFTWESESKAYLYTNQIVEYIYNPPAWSLKYCLDNDITRFAWAQTGQTIINCSSQFGGNCYLTRQPDYDKNDQESYIFAWGTSEDANNGDPTNFIYTETDTIVDGDPVATFAGVIHGYANVISGRGVVYYLKDEHGNECPYDFKNMLFLRAPDWQSEHASFMRNLGIAQDSIHWFYTFSWVNEAMISEDLTLRQDLCSDDGLYYGTKSNKILTKYREDIGQFSLPCNVFVASAATDNGFFNGCTENTLLNACEYNSISCSGAIQNTFECGCRNNTLDLGSSNNTFALACAYNVLGSNCFGNSFSAGCSFNIIGDGSSRNSLGTGCYQINIAKTHRNNTIYDGCEGIYLEASRCIVGKLNRHLNILDTATTPANTIKKYIIEIKPGIKGISNVDRKTLEISEWPESSYIIFEPNNTTHIILD